MKYFLPEYLDMNNTDKWEKACREYNDYLTANEADFSKAFLKEYRGGGFHDHKIIQIKQKFSGSGALDITVELAHKGCRCFLISKDVVKSSFSIGNQDKSILSGKYLYGEYYWDDSGFWNHNFLLGCGECEITAKKFAFKKKWED